MSVYKNFPPRKNLLGISGSLRRGSYCTAVLNSAREALAEKAEVLIFGLAEIPAYNEDYDLNPPAPVLALKAVVKECDGLIIVSPEYNHGTPGVLKNAIDWASRPGYRSNLVGKPVLLVTTSPTRFGGVRAHLQLLDMFTSTISRVVPGRQIAIQQVDKKIEDGRLVDLTSLTQVVAGAAALLREIDLVSSYAVGAPGAPAG